tara:strand:- start:695 stop:1213 length:519 start_codon:yes stop_codon:yes gene_type:complete
MEILNLFFGVKMNKAIYPGSFDPVTNGHLDIIARASSIFDQLIIGLVSETNKKNSLFSITERENMLIEATKSIPNVKVKIFNSLLVDFAKKNNSKTIIRGLRAFSDYEYEFKMSLMNRNLDDSIVTLFMMPHQSYTHISSSIVKEVSFFNGDVENYVPKYVYEKLKEKIEAK